jgi:hypothetical protein
MARGLVLVGLLAVGTAAGCSRVPTPPLGAGDYDSEAAQLTLVAALDAWKDGKAEALTRRQPPIRFVDDDLSSGYHLVSYRLSRPDAPVRPFQSVAVELRVRGRQGKIVERAVGYQVALQPRLAVIRSDQ